MMLTVFIDLASEYQFKYAEGCRRGDSKKWRVPWRASLAGAMLFFVVMIVSNRVILADEYLQLVTTIPVERDSTEITSINPIGDFNADGYGDLAIGLGSMLISPNFETVYLSYGGPSFDSLPDLRFFGDPNNETYCPAPEYRTSYGCDVTALGDFNGDGFDDFAVSASSLCNHVWSEGRIYGYFGGPNPDTIPDLTIDGMHDYDFMGALMASGDFNGDGYGDLIARAGDPFYGERVHIFLGGDPPDGSSDWHYDYPRQEIDIAYLYAGFDPNNDGYDDFSWKRSARDSSLFFFFGGDTLSHEPVLATGDSYYFFDFDFSGDNIDDFYRRIDGANYLCLGGSPLDFEPDYPLGTMGAYPFLYHRPGGDAKLIVEGLYRLVMYNLRIPPDTIPTAYFEYGFRRFPANPDIGDINADSYGEIAIGACPESLNQYVNIYSIHGSDNVHDGNGHRLAETHDLLSCYPDPFNGVVKITYQVVPEEVGEVEIQIFDLGGCIVRSFELRDRKPGTATVLWDATDNSGRKISSGVYFARAKTQNSSHSIRLIYLK